MNTEALNRMLEAKKYQMMAVKALFPEGQQEHIDTIEKELKALLSECVIHAFDNENKADCSKKEKQEKVHKVNID